MVDICKWSYIINAIKEYRLLGFFCLYRVSPGYMCCWCACLRIYMIIAIQLWFYVVWNVPSSMTPRSCPCVLECLWMEPHDQKPQRSPWSAKRPLSSGGDGFDKSGVIAPQHPPKDPSINQACDYVQLSSKEELMWSKCIKWVMLIQNPLDRSYGISSSNFTRTYKIIQFAKSRYGRVIITPY